MRYLGLTCLLLGTAALGQTYTDTVGGPIPDDGMVHEFEISVSGLPNALDTTSFGLEEVCFTIWHPWMEQLQMVLEAPDGTIVLLARKCGGSGTLYDSTCFRADAPDPISSGSAPFQGIYRAVQQLGMVNNGQDPNGTWTLKVLDLDSTEYAGAVFQWLLRFGTDPGKFAWPSSSDLPIFVIDVAQEVPNEPKVAAHLGVVYNGPGVQNQLDDPFTDYDGPIGIELRGNSSMIFPKKSYSIELRDAQNNDVDASLAGMPPESDWILFASYPDKSLLNASLAHHLARRMEHWSPRTQHVELIMDGHYLGVYVLMEKIKRDGDRVNIAKLDSDDLASDSLTGGYIVKLDWEAGNNNGGWVSAFPPPNDQSEEIMFLYDEPLFPEPEQAAYIQAYVDSFEARLNAPQFADPLVGYEPMIRTRTFVDYFILNELAKNIDAYHLSTFLYKDKDSRDGRLCLGPVWDFDQAFFNANYCGGNDPSGWALATTQACSLDVPFWWGQLLSDASFTDSLRCRWETLRSGPLHIDSLLTWCDTMAVRLSESQARNFQLWPIMGVPVWHNPQPVPPDYAGEIQELKTWLEQRIPWMDANLPQLIGDCLHDGITQLLGPGQWQLAPNPSSHFVTISRKGPGADPIALELVDALGRSLWRVSNSEGPMTIDVSQFGAGLYAVRVSAGKATTTLPLIKN